MPFNNEIEARCQIYYEHYLRFKRMAEYSNLPSIIKERDRAFEFYTHYRTKLENMK
jgi:hypothetical protein